MIRHFSLPRHAKILQAFLQEGALYRQPDHPRRPAGIAPVLEGHDPEGPPFHDCGIQGFIYGHLAKRQPHNCYVDAIGTKGVARMRRNFVKATVELYGIRETVHKTTAFNGKKLDVMVDIFGRSMLEGRNLGFPKVRDSVIASDLSWAMLKDAIANEPPVRGTAEEMYEILERRRESMNGFGLPVRMDQAVVSG